MDESNESNQNTTAPLLQSASAAPVALTARAVEMVKEIVEREARSGQGFRVSVNTGGCSGLSYELNFVEKAESDDVVFEQDGVRVFVAKDAVQYLTGTSIDYVTGLHRAGFRFSNPKADRTCGCGESFSI